MAPQLLPAPREQTMISACVQEGTAAVNLLMLAHTRASLTRADAHVSHMHTNSLSKA